MDEETAKYFFEQHLYNCTSYYVDKPLYLDTLTRYCSPQGGYIVRTPNSSDNIWKAPKAGWQSIPDIWFSYRFRLPMHPFILIILEVFNCGVGQLTLNTVLQINVLIAHCEELGE